MGKNPLTPEENKKADILCIISVVCALAPTSSFMKLFSFFNGKLAKIEVDNWLFELFQEMVTSVVGMMVIGCFIVALVLMIYVRVKYPQNVFGKVLMWVYIVLFIIAIIGIVVLLVACNIVCGTMCNSSACAAILPWQGVLWRM